MVTEPLCSYQNYYRAGCKTFYCKTIMNNTIINVTDSTYFIIFSPNILQEYATSKVNNINFKYFENRLANL